MIKKYLHFFLVMVFVLLTAVLLSPPASAQEVIITFTTIGDGTIDRQGPPYIIGQELSLEAIAGEGYEFDSWSDTQGDVSGSANPITFIIGGSNDIVATFAPIAETCFYLNTTVPAGGGAIICC